MSKSGKKLVSVMMSCALAVGSLTGCAQKTNANVSVIRELNPVKSYEMATIEKGVEKVSYTFYLIMEGYKKYNYKVNSYDNKLDQLLVSVGDYVHKGDVLLRFKSDEKNSDILEYLQKIEDNELLIEHYKLLMKADKNLDLKDEIEILEDDNELNRLYIGQFQTQIDFNEIKAEDDAYVTYINPALNYYIEYGSPLVTTVTVTDKFGLKTNSEYEFEIGKSYMATTYDKKVSYEVIVESVEPLEDGYSKIIFEIKDKTDLKNLNRLILDIEEESEGIDGCYVSKNFVYTSGDKSYVYIVDDDGNLSIRDVVIDRVNGNNVIFASGVNEGERVAKF